jgi:hypothetical protein
MHLLGSARHTVTVWLPQVDPASMFEVDRHLAIGEPIPTEPGNLVVHLDQAPDHQQPIIDRAADELAAVIERAQQVVKISTGGHAE